MKRGSVKRILGAAFLAVFLTSATMTAYGNESGGPGFEAWFTEPKMDPSMRKETEPEKGGPGAAAQGGGNLYGIRHAGGGLPLYEGMSDTGAVTATIPAGSQVELLEGPYDIYARVRVTDSGQEGYVKYAYLKNQNAVVNDDGMYTYEDMEQDIWGLRDRYPDKVQVEVTGTTADGRNLYHLTVGNSLGESNKKKILIHAGLHAREYANPKLVMEQMEMCLETWNSGKFHGRSYNELFSNVEIHVVPMVNPDGISISQMGEGGIRTQGILDTVRKCYQDDLARKRATADYAGYLRIWKANGRGVDLNRNFPINFGVGTVPNSPSYASYPGPNALSETESQNLKNLVERYEPYVTINYHSMGQVIYWDLNESQYRERNKAFADYMSSLTGYYKMPAEASTGGFLDWQMLRGTPTYSVTLETGSVACPFPDSEYANVWVKNYLVWPAAAEFALNH